MEIVTNQHGYKVEFNGSKTWFLSDINNDCYGHFSTKRKAINALKRTLKYANLEFTAV